MPVPDYEALMLPALEATSDGKEWSVGSLRGPLSEKLKLTAEELSVRLPSGSQAVFDNRLTWETTYLVKAGCLERPRRGVLQITKRGTSLLAEKPTKITNEVLSRFSEFRDFKSRRKSDVQATPQSVSTPEEQLERALADIDQSLSVEVLERLQKVTPEFFERVVLDLLLAMGYGGSNREGRTVGRSGDTGIDGVINEDKLGLEQVYVQAKRWSNTVGRPEVQSFTGSLEMHRASKGVFLTTGTFSSDARAYVERIGKKVVLIDGEALTRLMIEHDVGVSVQRRIAIKRVDSDYFDPE
jgi:restriction system protein